MILKDEGYIDEHVLPQRILEFEVKSRGLLPNENLSISIDLYEVEKDLIRQALIKAGGNQTQASRLLSVTRETLRYRVRKYGLAEPKKRSAQPQLDL